MRNGDTGMGAMPKVAHQWLSWLEIIEAKMQQFTEREVSGSGEVRDRDEWSPEA